MSETGPRLLCLFRTALAHADEGIALVDPEGRVVYWNRLARRLLGTRGIRPPVPVSALPPAASLALTTPEEGSASNSGAPARHVRRLPGGGRVVYFPLVPKEGDPSLQELRAEKMAAAGQLAAVVAKEIGAPLTAIQVAADYLLTRDGGVSGRAVEGLEVIQSQTRRIVLLTQQLLHLAESGRPHLQPVDVNAAVKAVCELLAKPLEEEGVSVDCSLAPGTVLASSDPEHLRQILVSLLLNIRGALTNWTGPRRLKVETGEANGRIFLRIAHTGPGMSEADAHAIFYPFVRLSQPPPTTAGLGLPIVRHLLEELRGSVRCTPNRGGGAVFLVTLEQWGDG